MCLATNETRKSRWYHHSTIPGCCIRPLLYDHSCPWITALQRCCSCGALLSPEAVTKVRFVVLNKTASTAVSSVRSSHSSLSTCDATRPRVHTRSTNHAPKRASTRRQTLLLTLWFADKSGAANARCVGRCIGRCSSSVAFSINVVSAGGVCRVLAITYCGRDIALCTFVQGRVKCKSRIGFHFERRSLSLVPSVGP